MSCLRSPDAQGARTAWPFPPRLSIIGPIVSQKQKADFIATVPAVTLKASSSVQPSMSKTAHALSHGSDSGISEDEKVPIASSGLRSGLVGEKGRPSGLTQVDEKC
jgi:hypothetical protein